MLVRERKKAEDACFILEIQSFQKMGGYTMSPGSEIPLLKVLPVSIIEPSITLGIGAKADERWKFGVTRSIHVRSYLTVLSKHANKR